MVLPKFAKQPQIAFDIIGRAHYLIGERDRCGLRNRQPGGSTPSSAITSGVKIASQLDRRAADRRRTNEECLAARARGREETNEIEQKNKEKSKQNYNYTKHYTSKHLRQSADGVVACSGCESTQLKKNLKKPALSSASASPTVLFPVFPWHA